MDAAIQGKIRLHGMWRRNENGGVRANLGGANLGGANLSGAKGLLDPREWLRQFAADELGVIVFRAEKGRFLPPAHWSFKPGNFLTEVVNPDRCVDCACGVSFATREWVRNEHPGQPCWRCRIRWIDLATVVVPYNTDGKARCGRLELCQKLRIE